MIRSVQIHLPYNFFKWSNSDKFHLLPFLDYSFIIKIKKNTRDLSKFNIILINQSLRSYNIRLQIPTIRSLSTIWEAHCPCIWLSYGVGKVNLQNSLLIYCHLTTVCKCINLQCEERSIYQKFLQIYIKTLSIKYLCCHINRS